MSSMSNLKVATRLLPGWVPPFFLSCLVVGLYVVALFTYNDRPSELVETATTAAIVLSTVIAFGFLVAAIVKSEQGSLGKSMSDGFSRGLTFVWATASGCLAVFVGAAGVYRTVLDNLGYSISAVLVVAILGMAYWATSNKQEEKPETDPISGMSKALALPANFAQTPAQRPAFQVTMADTTRLAMHQAGRIIAYKGSNCLIDGEFFADLDLNARTAKIFSDMNLIATSQFINWRMHMLLIGSAAEHVIRGTSSEAAFDDLQSFDDLAVKFLMLGDGRHAFLAPASEAEATLKAARLGMIRKNVWSRCLAAAEMNKETILQLVRLMRIQPCLTHGDLKHLLEKVEMPLDFPVAEFDTDEMMERALLGLIHEAEPVDEDVGIESSALDVEPQPVRDNVREFPTRSSTLQA